MLRPPRQIGILCAIFATAVVGNPLAFADATFDKLVAFLRKPENQAAYYTSIINPIPAAVFKICPGTTVAGVEIVMLKSVAFSPAGLPISGQWIEHVKVKSCGRAKMFNILMQAEADGIPHGKMLLPGGTRSDPTLQADSMNYVMAASRAFIPKTCQGAMVIDTQHLGAEGAAVAGAKSAPYKERWTVDACGKKNIVTMHFIPDAKGTTITVNPKESSALAP